MIKQKRADSLEREKAEAESSAGWICRPTNGYLQRLLELKDAQLAAMQTSLAEANVASRWPDVAPEAGSAAGTKIATR